ncbi:MAG: tRNA (N6-isopentenyl adenosine(37)-C2)-methylthiotransferase MiaB [bacterium]
MGTHYNSIPIPSNKVYLYTFGCQMNEHDSERIAGLLDTAGYRFVSREEQADIILFNTCSIRETAEQRVYGRVTQLKPLKKLKPHLIIGLCGCMAEKYQQELFKNLPIIDFVIGPRQWMRLKDTLDAVIRTRQQRVVCGTDMPVQSPQSIKRDSRIKAWVSIMEGCDNFCSYCVVPYVRGRQVSRPLTEIRIELEQLAKQGYKEITLLGQNVNSYQHKGMGFADVIRSVNQIDGIHRFRYMTSHPRDFNLETIQAILDSPKFCEQFHLPIQSGSDAILARMNRGYTIKHYLNLVHEIRARFPTASITTDIIVGFPGETESEYQKTVTLMQSVQWDSAFLFMFSPREGTKAATLESQIPVSIRKQRIQEVVALQKQISATKLRQLIGSSTEILIEGLSKHKPNQWIGRTRQNVVVVFTANKTMQPGDLITVTITDASAFTLFARWNT